MKSCYNRGVQAIKFDETWARTIEAAPSAMGRWENTGDGSGSRTRYNGIKIRADTSNFLLGASEALNIEKRVYRIVPAIFNCEKLQVKPVLMKRW
jgi:hypothetical protein